MRAAHIPAITGFVAIDGLDGQTLASDHRRLLICVAVSAVMLATAIATIKISLQFDFSRLMPAILDVTLRDEAESEPAPEVAEPAEILPAEETAPPAAAAEPETASTETVEAPPATAAATEPAQPVDWYAALERAAAETVDEHATVDSLHPEFDELRRIAAERYAPAQANRSKPARAHVEKDIYGRTLLRRGNCFQVLDDTNVGNRYAFETFERHVWQCGFSFGKKRGKNLPWVEPIRAKYNHLRDPDGSRSVPTPRPTGD